MNEQFGCLILILGDLCVPEKRACIPKNFQTLLNTDKIEYILCVGNIGDDENYEVLKNISDNIFAVHGELDLVNSTSDIRSLPEHSVVEICNKKFGLVRGSFNSLFDYDEWQRKLDCDFLVTATFSKICVDKHTNYTHLCPGSISGADCQNPPSFILMSITEEVVTVYAYQLVNDKVQVAVTNL